MAITFDKTNKLIVISIDKSTVSIQELINAIRDFEDESDNLEVNPIANAYGKQDLGGGAKVGITLELVNDWRVKFADREGPTYDSCSITGGNLVAINTFDNNPIYPSTYTQISLAQSTSPTLVEGGGTTPDELWEAQFRTIHGFE